MLTERLLVIAQEVDKDHIVADIGSDHAYIPIYLMKQNIAKKVIITDISREALNIARHNCKSMAKDMRFEFRQANGLKALKKKEADTIIIAGMGGKSIKTILSKQKQRALEAKKLILQPRSRSGELRHWLVTKGFKISKEILVREGRYICVVIVAEPGKFTENYNLSDNYEDIVWEMPPWLVDTSAPLLGEYIGNILDRENRILRSMENSKCIGEEDKAAIKRNIEYLERL